MRLLSLLFITITFSVNSYSQFTEIKRILLPENHLIGNIRSIDVLGESYLITDLQQQVFLYKEGTSALIKLDPENCFPGFDLQPIHTFHQADSSIFLINATLPGYRFEADGSCKGSVDKDFVQVLPNRLAVNLGEEGYFYTLRSFLQQPLKMRKYRETGRLVKDAELNEPPFPAFNYRYVGGGTAVQAGILYYILPSGGEVHRYDIKGKVHLVSVPFVPEYKPAIEKDISADPASPQMFKDLAVIMNENYKVISMHKLSEKYLLIQTSFKEGEGVKYGLHFFNMESNRIEEKNFIFNQPFSFARSNKAYRIIDERMENEEVLNPGIIVYEFEGDKYLDQKK